MSIYSIKNINSTEFYMIKRMIGQCHTYHLIIRLYNLVYESYQHNTNENKLNRTINIGLFCIKSYISPQFEKLKSESSNNSL